MISITNELYDLIYKNSVWPQDLLENLKDPDYLSVKFDSYLQGTMAEVVFLDEGKKIIANYFFNSKGLVQKIEMIENESVFTVYSRIDEIAKLLLKTDNIHCLQEIVNLIAA
ncbi:MULTISPECIES: hypothetical protein [Paenibacillus]|uniref:hypothetical protein n=1 Tax=Paenibacillus TaxID=44249 RepID=UPI00096C0124|nr:hypothetical protein [Paenibacillus odorifer]OMD87838.1 hypothetical protein BSK53_02295 [Paenibacillus odorifer]